MHGIGLGRRTPIVLVAALGIAAWLPGCSSSGSSGGADALVFTNPDASGTSTCSPQNCNGCCEAGKCQDGTAVLACGTGGVACQSCQVGQTCSGGQCGGMCGPNSCNGCCSGDSCVSGTQDSACGNHGAMCVACGMGQVCGSGGTCTLDLNTKWDVQALDGTVAKTNASGGAWDPFGGAPDPYVSITAGGVSTQMFTGQSSTQSNTYTPAWNMTVLSNVPAAVLKDHFEIHFMDADPIGADDEICPVDAFDVTQLLQMQPIVRKCPQGTVRLQLVPR